MDRRLRLGIRIGDRLEFGIQDWGSVLGIGIDDWDLGLGFVELDRRLGSEIGIGD